jgi:dCTP diphosphatase
MTVEEITAKIKKFRDDRDWKQFHTSKDMAMAISIEANELMEHFLWKTSKESDQRVLEKKEEIADEISDIAMYLFELADNLGINLLKAMDRKLIKNAQKYPVEKAKGSHKKYTELV